MLITIPPRFSLGGFLFFQSIFPAKEKGGEKKKINLFDVFPQKRKGKLKQCGAAVENSLQNEPVQSLNKVLFYIPERWSRVRL